MHELAPGDYWSIVKRHRKYFFITATAILAVALLFAFTWSNYRSVATVAIAPSKISAETTLPPGMTMNDYNNQLADLRISQLQQKVLSTASLIEIITKFDLYSKDRASLPVAEVAKNKMFNKIRVNLFSSTLANPSAAQKASAGALSAIAFNVSFDYPNPIIAQQVTNELVTRFLDEDLKDRRSATRETTAFLDAQIKALDASLAEQEKQIAEYRAKNVNAVPEAMAFNQQAIGSILINLQNVESEITANEGTQGKLRAQLASVDPYSRVIADGQVLTTPAIQLKALKSQFATLNAQYGDKHPDVIKTRNQIKALEKQVGPQGTNSAELRSKISDIETNLAAAKETYGPDHPDVIALQRQLTKLEAKLAKSGKSVNSFIKEDADNPAYLQLTSELRAAEEQHKSLERQKESLKAQQAKYEKAIQSNPEAQQKLAQLTRDYENGQMRYRALKEKKMSADMSETIEEDRSGERLMIIDPPELPIGTQPGRKVFVLAGFVLSIIGGLASVLAAHVLSQSVTGPRHLESLIGVAPMVVVPHLVTQHELRQVKTGRLRRSGWVALAALVAAVLFFTLVLPFDVFTGILSRKLGM